MSIKEPKVYTRSVPKIYSDIYLSGPIEEPELYIEELQTLREAGEQDEIRIYFNTGGGRIDSAIQWVNVIRNCKAKVTGVLEGTSHSAGTYIFLACDDWEVNLGVIMLIHNYSGGAYGKGSDLVDNVKANAKWVKNIMALAYEGFLTEDELTQVNLNQDIWMESDEILLRLKSVAAIREAKYQTHVEELRQEALEQVKELTNESPADSENISECTEKL